MQNVKPILLVEDDRVDAMTIIRALEDLKVTNPLVHTPNGEEALEYLRSEGNEKPCVIFLDLNMPKMNGIEFLKTAGEDEALKKIPVIVFTASREEYDVGESLERSVAGWMTKPVDYKKFVEAIRTADLHWTLSELPDGD